VQSLEDGLALARIAPFEHPAQRFGHLLGIADVTWNRVDDVAVDTGRQHAAMTIGDVAAPGIDVDRLALLTLGLRDQ
jgi:ribosome-binding protein aMBF1 (putative translation factor)